LDTVGDEQDDAKKAVAAARPSLRMLLKFML
jgi:hypothetical protein